MFNVVGKIFFMFIILNFLFLGMIDGIFNVVVFIDSGGMMLVVLIMLMVCMVSGLVV